MTSRVLTLSGLLLSAVFLVSAACMQRRLPAPVTRPEQALTQVLPQVAPLKDDDEDRDSLMQATRNSLLYYDRLPEDTHFMFGPHRVSLQRAKRSLKTFRTLLTESKSWEELADRVRQQFVIYRSVGSGTGNKVLFTGYYEPIISGNTIPDEHYRFPIYGVPDDLVVIQLERFRQEYRGMRLVGRCDDNMVVPYYTREEIDSDGLLSGRGYELAWVADPVARFFLHIQGSGRIRLPNGEFLQINYAASNGRPYRSIGKLMIEERLVPREAMSMQAIRRHLAKYPSEAAEILNYNPSYVFFRTVEEGPLGSIAVPLTAGRAIATDLNLFPRGALAFIVCDKPILAQDGVIIGWKSFGRYVLNQDSGGAIRGPGRADIFWGDGPYGTIAAGHLKHYGDLYFLLLKE